MERNSSVTAAEHRGVMKERRSSISTTIGAAVAIKTCCGSAPSSTSCCASTNLIDTTGNGLRKWICPWRSSSLLVDGVDEEPLHDGGWHYFFVLVYYPLGLSFLVTDQTSRHFLYRRFLLGCGDGHCSTLHHSFGLILVLVFIFITV